MANSTDFSVDKIPEIISRLTEAVATAGATKLTLAAFAFLLGCGVVVYLLKNTKPQLRLAGVIAWMVFCLIVLFITAAPWEPEPRLAKLNIAGQQPVEAQSFELNLGYIENDQDHETELSIQTSRHFGRVAFVFANRIVEARWRSGSDEESLDSDHPKPFAVKVKASPGAGEQQHDIFISSAGRRLFILRVRFVALAGRVVQPSVSSGPRSSGRGKDFSAPYRVCVEAPAIGEYFTEANLVSPRLTGDRDCSGWATCRVDIESSGHSACLTFTLQGHDECLGPFARCDAVRSSEGHIGATFRLRRSRPVLAVLASQRL